MRWGTTQWGSTQWGAEGAGVAPGAKNLSEFRSLLAAYGAGPSFTKSIPNRAHTTTERVSGLLGVDGGLAFVGSSVNISRTPDLAVFLHGWADYSLSVNINPQIIASLRTSIKSIQEGQLNIGGVLRGFSFYGLTTTVFSVAAESLTASISPVLGVLFGYVNPVVPVSLSARIGGHLAELFYASVSAVIPAYIGGWIRGGFASTSNITSSIQITGDYSSLWGRLVVVASGQRDISAVLRVRTPVDMAATIESWASLDIFASIKHIFLGPQLKARIKATASLTRDVGGFVRAMYRSEDIVPSYLKTVVRAHTGPKPYNIGIFSKPFPLNRLLFGTGRGLSFVSIEPLFGLCPDLSASVVGFPFSFTSMLAVIRGIRVSNDTSGFSAKAVGVPPVLIVSTVAFLFELFRNLSSAARGTGGFRDMRGSIKILTRSTTGTSETAGFTFTRSTTRQFFATTRGVLVSVPVRSDIKRWFFRNNHQSPDVWAALHGWAVSSLSATIGIWSQYSLPTAINVLDVSHLKALQAVVRGVLEVDFPAAITISGGYTDMSVSVNPRFAVFSLPTKINGFLGTLGRETVCVHTKPFITLGARINFNVTHSCFVGSAAVDFGARLVSSARAVSALYTSIYALRASSGISASITGLRRIRVNTLPLCFRSAARSNGALAACVTGWSRNQPHDFPTSIYGDFHSRDLTAVVTCIRIKPALVFTAEDVTLVNIREPSVKKTAEVLFGSGPQSYTYDPEAGALFSESGEAWSVLVRGKKVTASFHDGAYLEQKHVRNIADYNSLDEAIRAALNSLISPPSSDIYSLITSRGTVVPLTARIFATGFDRLSDLSAKISQVVNEPVIFAYIASIGSVSAFPTYIRSTVVQSLPLSCSLTSWGASEVAATITVI